MSARPAASATVAQAASSADMPSPDRTTINGCCFMEIASGTSVAASPPTVGDLGFSATLETEIDQSR